MADFGRFVVHQRLGIGGMAEVYLAQSRDGVPRPGWLALKVLNKELEDVPRAVELFENEGHIGTVLRHPNIVPVFEMGVIDRRHYIVMQYVDGPDTAALLVALTRAGLTLGLPLAGHLTLQVLRALDHAHFAVRQDGRPMGLIHRDVTPDNVFLTRKGNALLADFGIAKLSGLEFFTDPRMGIRGKLPFMSPERVMGQAIDGRSDEFSAALLFLELSSGIRPYAVKPGETFAVLRERVARRDLPKPRALVPGMSRRVEGVVLRALEARINKRFPTCGEFAVALEEALRKEQQLGGAPALAELIALVAPPRGAA